MGTGIDYVGETINYVTGCTKVSPACKNCYAEVMTKRNKGMEKARNKKTEELQAKGEGMNRKITNKYQDGFDKVVEHWDVVGRLFGKKPKRYFVNSMSDTFHKDVSWDFQFEMFRKFARNPRHTFLIFTKRSTRLHLSIKDIWFHLSRNGYKTPLKNVQIIVTTENQEMFDKRMEHFQKVDAAVKGISIEPMLGPIDLSAHIKNLDWVICGGESGTNARPMHPEWVESIRDQCHAANVPFWFKSWGTWGKMTSVGSDKSVVLCNNGESSKFEEMDFQGIELIGKGNPVIMSKFGKKKAGDLLNGKQYKEIPK